MTRAPRIGLVAAADLSRYTVGRVLREAGFDLVWSGAPAALDLAAVEVDAWLVDGEEMDLEEALARLLEHSDKPLLINEPVPPLSAHQDYQRWLQRLLRKLEEAAVEGEVAGEVVVPQAVWVLAASTGGPAAVHRFLAALPRMPLALIYAQHIEPAFDQTLAYALASSRWPVALCSGESRLGAGRLLLAPADRQVQLLPFDRLVATRQPWPGPYRPGIDQIVAQVARQYRRRAGLIVFSGLCDDGAVGARVMQANGGTVWVQQPEQCISAAMPEAALATGCVSFAGSPEQLAEALAGRYAPPAHESL